MMPTQFSWIKIVRVWRSMAFGLLVIDAVSTAAARDAPRPWRFAFAPTAAENGFVPVTPATRYTDERGFGFEGGAPGVSPSGLDAGQKPFFFAVNLPEGNYRVTLTTGDRQDETTTTVKAELRRLMLEAVHTEAGEFKTSAFMVNVRRPQITGRGEVRLKDRERTSEWRAWDDRLTLEFSGTRPTVTKLEIEPVRDLPMLFIIGDSTVCDQPLEPYASWGQMLPRFFQPTIVLANHGESGESYHSSLSAGRFAKIFSQMKPGDYLLMQFGHNDMKSVDEASYSASIRRVVQACRDAGGIPIVVSPMERRGFDANGKVRESLRGFPEAAQKTAEQLNAAFIDLHSMSKEFYEALGPERAPLAFAGPGRQRDATHHNNYGSYQLAKCVVRGIQQAAPDLATHLIDGLPPFDPAHPDPIDTFALPASPLPDGTAPEGK